MINAIAIDDEPLALQVVKTFCDEMNFIHLVKTFSKPREGLKYIETHSIDLLFVDIHMPAMSGINLVKSIPKNIMVIFTTAHSDYAAESYELNAIDYLLKPIHQSRFEQAVNKAHEYYLYTQERDHAHDTHLFVRADFSVIKILLSDILLIEGFADYIKIYIKNRQTVVTRMTMKDMMKKLSPKDFMRVNRSFIVPMSQIQAMRNKTIFLSDKKIPIGNTYLKEFLKRFPQS
jgi:DNA-binding LytR/AlgR family response regulator